MTILGDTNANDDSGTGTGTTDTGTGTDTTTGTDPGTGQDQTGTTDPGADGTDGKGTDAGDTTDGGDEGAKAGAPEKYEEFKAPDGMQIDQALVDTFVPKFKELNLSQDQAQVLVDEYAKVKAGELQQWNEHVANWGKQCEADPEIGGKAFQENVTIARNLVDKYGTPELKNDMKQYGFGSNPHLVKLLVKLGKMSDEAPHRTGSNTNTGSEGLSLAQRLYGTE